MSGLILCRALYLKLAALLIVAGFLGSGAMKVYSDKHEGGAQALQPSARQEDERGGKDKDEGAEKYLFVWTGDQARTNPDFLAVVNFDESSPDYGTVITTVPLPAPGATAN